jgi:hypothetical protein
LGRIWKRLAIAYFRALSQHFLGGNGKSAKNLRIPGLWAKYKTWDF